MEIKIEMNENFGLNVRKKLLDLGVSQKEIAERINITKSYLSQILNDVRYKPDIRKKILAVIDEIEREKSN